MNLEENSDYTIVAEQRATRAKRFTSIEYISATTN